MDWSIDLSVVIAAISAIVAGLSVWNSWQSKNSASEAKQRAERSAAAAERSAQAAESHAQISHELFEVGKVRIQMGRNHSGKPPREAALETSAFIVNTGTHDAYDVRWDAPSMNVVSVVDSMPVLPPGVRVPIFPQQQWGQSDNRVYVYFRRVPDGPEETLTFFY